MGNYAALNGQLRSTQYGSMQHLTEGLVPLLVAVASHGASHGKTLHFVVALTNLSVRFGLSKATCMLRLHTCCAFPLSSVEEQAGWPSRPKGLLRILPSLLAATSGVRRRRRRLAIAEKRRLFGGARIERRLGGGMVGPVGMPTVLGRLWRRTRSPPHKLKPPPCLLLPIGKRLTKMVFAFAIKSFSKLCQNMLSFIEDCWLHLSGHPRFNWSQLINWKWWNHAHSYYSFGFTTNLCNKFEIKWLNSKMRK